jgi:hypothetical protein
MTTAVSRVNQPTARLYSGCLRTSGPTGSMSLSSHRHHYPPVRRGVPPPGRTCRIQSRFRCRKPPAFNPSGEERWPKKTKRLHSTKHKGAGQRVGRGNPPKQTQFRKGTSGNPNGRPKGSKNLSTLIREAANQQVTATIAGKQRRISTVQATTVSWCRWSSPLFAFPVGTPRSKPGNCASSAVAGSSTPMRRMRSPCCARAVGGHATVAAPPPRRA